MAEDRDTSSYLKQLRFDPGLLNSFAAKYVVNFRLMILLVMAVVIWGSLAYVNLPRRTNPEVEIPIVFISTVLPGGNPEDVEQLVSIPLEEAIEGVEKIDRLTSSSQESVSTIVAEFESSVNPKEARDEIQSAVDTVSLPDDAIDPNVIDLDFENFPVWTFSVTSDKDLPSLFEFAQELQEKIEAESTISQVSVTGIETNEFQVLIEPEKMTQLGINPFSLQQAISAQTASYPGGVITARGSNYGLSLDAVIEDVDDLRALQIELEGQTYVLGEIATVMERAKPNQFKAYLADSDSQATRSVSFSVFKRTGADLDEAARAAKDAANDLVESYDGRFELVTVMDFDEMISEQFRDLFNDFFTSIGLVFGTLLLFLGIRQATIASLVIPISFLFTFGAVNAMGLSLNFLTLFSLLLAQGMIVDDVIVIISAMTDYFKTKKFTPLQTGLLVWRDFIEPTLTSNLTNVWSFVPMLLATGIIGEFTKSIPLVVTAALVGSTAISLLVTIPLMVLVLKPSVPSRVKRLFQVGGFLLVLGLVVRMLVNNLWAILVVAAAIWVWVVGRLTWRVNLALVQKWMGKRKLNVSGVRYLIEKIQTGFFSLGGLISGYKKLLLVILGSKANRRKTVFAVVSFSLFSYLLVPFGLVKNEFFPKTDQEQIYVGLELPVGTNEELTNQVGLELLDKIRTKEGVEYVTAEIGAPVENTFISTSAGGDANVARLSVKLPPQEDREKSSIQIAQDLRDEYGDFAKGEVVVAEETGGPPAGADLQITLLGEELSVLEQKADEVVAFLDGLEGAVDADKSIQPGLSKLSFVPDDRALIREELSVQTVGFWLRTYAAGFELDEVRFDGDEKEDVVLRMSNQLRTPEELSTLSIPKKGGGVPLNALGKLEVKASPTQISRQDGERSITVTATVQPGYGIPVLGQQLEEFADAELNLPPGYSWETGGINEENQKSINSILQAMVIAAILIAGTMVVQLQSFRKAAVVMLVIPLAVSGVFILFSLTGTPISFPALVGVLALFGIVVKNSILIVDKINANVDIGLPLDEAVADGASSRLEPIIFSSITNFIGLLPITISDPLWRGLGGAIISGLTFSGTIMLFFIPVVYYLWFAGEVKQADEVV